MHMSLQRMLVTSICVLMFASASFQMLTTTYPEDTEGAELPMTVEPQYSAASPPNTPGHVVFAEYVGATWCGPCMGYSSPSLKQLAEDLPDDFTYVSFVDNTPTDSAPINRVNHVMTNSGGYPTTAFGDAESGQYYQVGGSGSDTDGDGYADNQFDTQFSNGGDVINPQDHRVSVTQSSNGGYLDITIEAEYLGNSMSSTVYVYGAVTEHICSVTYDDGSKPHYCWAEWLTNSANTGFEQFVLLPGTPQSASWTVPASVVGGGATNAVTTAMLMSGSHSTWNDVLAAANSEMGPLIDLDVGQLGLVNDDWAGEGYVVGDSLTLTATVTNDGEEAYTDGGMIEFYHVISPGQESLVHSESLQAFSSNGATQTFTTIVDTSSFSGSSSSTSFRVELANLVADKHSANNAATALIALDEKPSANEPQILGASDFDRDTRLEVQVSANPNDLVDEMTTMIPQLKVAESGMNQQWSDSWVAVGPGLTPDDTYYSFMLEPPDDAPAGIYDVAVLFTDARGHQSSFAIKNDAFTLLNGKPVIKSDPIPTCKVGKSERISMVDHISDPETSLDQLMVTSQSANFIAWHAETQEIEVQFDQIPINANGEVQFANLYVTVSDGTSDGVSSDTLLFNVIENGMPRWNGPPSQGFDEGSGVSVNLRPYLSDTDNAGNPSDVDLLSISIIGTEHQEMLTAELDGYTLRVDAMDDDVFGTTTIGLRASDGVEFSDTQMTVNINGINDAPEFDISVFDDLVLLVGKKSEFDFSGAITDVDGSDEEARLYTTVDSDEIGALSWKASLGRLTLEYNVPGEHTILISTQDRLGALNEYELTVLVVSHLPLILVEDATQTGDILLSAEKLVEGQIPVITLSRHNDVGLTGIEAVFQICSISKGICYDRQVFNLDDDLDSWTMSLQPAGKLHVVMDDEIKLKITAIDTEGFDHKMDENHYLVVVEGTGASDAAPEEVELTDAEIDLRMSEIEDELLLLETQINLITDEEDPQREAYVEQKQELLDEQVQLDCQRSDAQCAGFSGKSGSSFLGDIDPLALGLAGLITFLVLVLATLMFVRVRGSSEPDWGAPSTDTVANSMFGGAAAVFQTDLGPPLPPDGLPAGWTMEQWKHYGQNYLQQLQLRQNQR